MTDQSPAAHADRAVGAIRDLNRATLSSHPSRPGYLNPVEVSAAVASLEVLADRLPQAIRQARQWLADADNAHLIGDDRGVESFGTVVDACHCLGDAEDLAFRLTEALDRAHAHTAHLTSTGDDPT